MSSPAAPSVIHFATAAAFRRWLRQNHARATALHVGFYRRGSGRRGLSYPEAVDEALCFGWIDGIVRRIDADSFTHRFTPRRPGSIWSNVNVQHVARLTRLGRMHRAGLAAFAARRADKTGIYAYEQKPAAPARTGFSRALTAKFRADRTAWTFWRTLPPRYQRKVIAWITGAVQEETRDRRFVRLLKMCAAGRRLDGK